MDLRIQHEESGDSGRFFISQAGTPVAEMTYYYNEDKNMVIDHTEVLYQLQGHGIGKQLFEVAVAYARKHHLRIRPVCSFVQTLLYRTDKYKDLL
jgi:predicted GNAT family acetyltransferase